MTETKKGMNASVRMVLVLFLIAAITALCLGLVDHVTRGRIAEYLEEKKAAAMQEVLAADSYGDVAYTGADSRIVGISDATTNGALVGYVVEVIVGGSQGDINMLVGVDAQGAVSGVAIVDMKETAGLGDKAAEPEWRAQFVGKSGELAVSKDGGEIDALTGATVTSRAVTEGVNAAWDAVAGKEGLL